MKRKINILEISSRSDIGGGPEQLFKIVANLNDHFRFYCACPDQQTYYDKIATRKIPVFKLAHRRFEIKSFIRLLYSFQNGFRYLIQLFGSFQSIKKQDFFCIS